MKTITKTIELYKYDELNEKAQQVAKMWYLYNCRESAFFSDMVSDDLEYLFGKNDLDVEYSLAHSQGDGLNIYGDITVGQILDAADSNKNNMPVFEKFHNALSDNDREIIRKCAEEVGIVNVPKNASMYCYCYANTIDYYGDCLSLIDQKNFDLDALRRFNDALIDLFIELCDMYEEWGYEYFYEVDDDTMVEECDGNEWLFTADGNIYFE